MMEKLHHTNVFHRADCDWAKRGNSTTSTSTSTSTSKGPPRSRSTRSRLRSKISRFNSSTRSRSKPNTSRSGSKPTLKQSRSSDLLTTPRKRSSIRVIPNNSHQNLKPLSLSERRPHFHHLKDDDDKKERGDGSNHRRQTIPRAPVTTPPKSPKSQQMVSTPPADIDHQITKLESKLKFLQRETKVAVSELNFEKCIDLRQQKLSIQQELKQLKRQRDSQTSVAGAEAVSLTEVLNMPVVHENGKIECPRCGEIIGQTHPEFTGHMETRHALFESGNARLRGRHRDERMTKTGIGDCLDNDDDDDDEWYPTIPKHRVNHRGIALVIGNGNSGDVQRASHKDAKRMAKVLRQAGYEVRHHEDVPDKKLERLALETSQDIPPTCDSFVLYFSGHGIDGRIIGHDKKNMIKIDESCGVEIGTILEYFQPQKCKALENKPKIFLWDCCRGNKVDSIKSWGDLEHSQALRDPVIPKHVDFLNGYSCAQSYTSYIGDCKTDGLSLWTYYLIQRIEKSYGKRKDFTKILTHVQRDVANVCKKSLRKRQAPNFNSFLLRSFSLS